MATTLGSAKVTSRLICPMGPDSHYFEICPASSLALLDVFFAALEATGSCSAPDYRLEGGWRSCRGKP